MSHVRSVLLLTLALSGAALAAPGPTTAAPESPDWGGTDRILVLVGAEQFQPRSSGQAWARETGIYSIGGIAAFDATLHLPSGALLTYLELDYCDTAPAPEVLVFIEDCSFLGGGCAGFAALSSNDGLSGCNYVSMDLTNQGYVVNNNSRRLRLLASTASGSNTNQLIGAYIGYKLQVSPAPASATFADVPTSHPYLPLRRGDLTCGRHERLRGRQLLPRSGGDSRTDGGVPGRCPGIALPELEPEALVLRIALLINDRRTRCRPLAASCLPQWPRLS